MKYQSRPKLPLFDFKEIIVKNISTVEPFLKISHSLLGGPFDSAYSEFPLQ